MKYRAQRLFAAVLLVAAGCAGSESSDANLPSRAAASPHRAAALTGLRVRGNHLVDGNDRAVHLHGINRSGTEYACVQGWGIFDGPSDASSVEAMTTWNVNIVRVPLNEDCWLDINGIQQQYAGAS